MSKKEKAIHEAYRKFIENENQFLRIKYLLDKNGWLPITGLSSSEDLLDEIKIMGFKFNCLDEFYREFHEKGSLYRPKSLIGLESNNGWKVIESESDLPTECGNYEVFNQSKNWSGNYEFDSVRKEWFNHHLNNIQGITHYRPKDKGLPLY